MRRLKELLKSERFEVLFTMVICFLLHVVVIRQFDCWFSTDTDGYWLHAATFTGRDWSGVAQGMTSYYAWGYSLLLTIPFLLTNNFGTMYRIAVLMNVILCTLVVPLAYSLAKKIAPEINRKILLLFSLITSCYSSYVMLSAVSLAETLVFFLMFLATWLMYRFFETDKNIWGFLAAIVVGYCYITHHRNLGTVVAFCLVALLMLWKEKKWKKFLVLIVPLAAMMCLDMGVNQWLNARENAGMVYSQNTYQSMVNKASSGITFYSLISMIENTLGEVWYTIVGTFLLAGIGICSLFKRILKSITEKNEQKEYFSIYVICNWIFLMLISVFFCMHRFAFSEGRIDSIFYGRYMEASVVFFILMGMIELYRWRSKTINYKDIIVGLVGVVSLSILVHCFTTAYQDTGNNWFSIVAVLFPFSYGNMKMTVLGSSVALMLIGCLVVALFVRGKKSDVVLAGIIALGMFIYIGYNATYTVARKYAEEASVVNNPTYNSEFREVCDYLSNSDSKNIIVVSENAYEAFSYQFCMRDWKVTWAPNINNINLNTYDGYILVKQNLIGQEMMSNVIFSTDTHYLCAFSRTLSEKQSEYIVSASDEINILWLGTSIPMGSKYGNYPELVEGLLGEKVKIHNISKSASAARAGYFQSVSKDDKMGYAGFHDNFRSLMKSISLSQEEKREIYNNWERWDGVFTYEGGFDTPSDNMELYLSCSYDADLYKYLTAYQIDYVVYDVGYNDVICGDYAESDDIITVPEQYGDRTYYIGASEYIFEKINEYSPNTKIIIAGHYSNKDYPLLSTAQQLLADTCKVPLYKTWEYTNWSTDVMEVPGYWESENWIYDENCKNQLTEIERWCSDGIHPGNDINQAANMYLARIHAQCLKSLIEVENRI